MECRHQTSLTSGCLFEHTKLPLTTWFLAICPTRQAEVGLSAPSMNRQTGVRNPTVWLLHRKSSRATAARENVHLLEIVFQVDDAYLCGERAGGTPARGSENKVPFLAAVSLDDRDHSRFLKRNLVNGFTAEAIGRWAQAPLAPGCAVISDGLRRFAAVTSASCTKQGFVVDDRKPQALPQFLWLKTVLGNLKTTLARACHSLKYGKHAAHHLAAFA